VEFLESRDNRKGLLKDLKFLADLLDLMMIAVLALSTLFKSGLKNAFGFLSRRVPSEAVMLRKMTKRRTFCKCFMDCLPFFLHENSRNLPPEKIEYTASKSRANPIEKGV
jgi:hypothetical protein